MSTPRASADHGHVLVVDDEAPQVEILRVILESEGYAVTTAASARQALARLGDAGVIEAVLTDLKMPDASGIALLERLLAARPGLSVVIMTAHGSIDSAVEAMRKGAFDYLTKPLDREGLLLTVRRAVERGRLLAENQRLQEQLRERFSLDNVVGSHGSMQAVFRVVHKVAASSSTVLIYGESGTGKELVARALHLLSPRAQQPFYAVNLGALPETILEAELFGHEKGAFTGADARRVGLIEQASGSTLFLDEIGELKRDLQVKLLRVLQERELLRVGGMQRIPVDVRVVAATNRDLEREVREGRFREDLFYRLNVIPIVLPPLRARHTDVPLLVEHFLAKHADPGRPRRLAPEALDALVAYAWPGNVRELESVVERTLLLSDHEEIRVEDLPPSIRTRPAPLATVLAQIPDAGIDLEALERALLRGALDKAGGNVTRAARLLGLTRRTLQYRLQKLDAAPSGAVPAPDGASRQGAERERDPGD